ncbi:MAG: hypothetical protein IPN58_16910, partial [Anaerolineales bacterium]|nr:hypothetical protein [Anaerolineales bacterium]
VMLPTWSWFHIAFGFILGVLATIFVIKITQLSKKHGSVRKLVGALLIFSLLVTVLFYFYVSAVSGGISAEWQFLGFPAIGEPAVKVLKIGYVETKSGNIYHSICVDCQDKNWELVKEVPKSQAGEQFYQRIIAGHSPFCHFRNLIL